MSLTAIEITVTGPWVRGLNQLLIQGVLQSEHPVIVDMYNQWAHRYSDAMGQRFSAASAGDGTWPPLSDATLKARAYRLTRSIRNRTKGADWRARRLPDGRVINYRAGGRWTGRAYQKFAEIISNAAILRDTGVLIHALDIGTEGNITRRIGSTLEFGFGGPAKHPGGTATIGQIAAAHQAGGVHRGVTLPQREILVQPRQAVVDAMRLDCRNAWNRLCGGANAAS